MNEPMLGITIALILLFGLVWLHGWATRITKDAEELAHFYNLFNQAVTHALKHVKHAQYDDARFYLANADKHLARFQPQSKTLVQWKEKLKDAVQRIRDAIDFIVAGAPLMANISLWYAHAHLTKFARYVEGELGERRCTDGNDKPE